MKLIAVSPALCLSLVVLSAAAFHRNEELDPQCGLNCVTNNDCSPSMQCSHCYHGVCIVGETCGAPCQVTTDCNQLSNCSLCTGGTCSAGCGQPCNSTSQCQSYGCDACLQGTCQMLTCNQVCNSDADCAGSQLCTQCDQKVYGEPGLCRSGCGQVCTDDSQCRDRCSICDGGICTV